MEGIFAQARPGVSERAALPCFHPQARLICAPPAGPVLLCYPGKVQGLLSLVLQEMRGRDSSPTLMTLGQILPTASGGKGSPPHQCHLVQTNVRARSPMLTLSGHLYHTHVTRANSPMLSGEDTGPALLQCLFIGRAISPMLTPKASSSTSIPPKLVLLDLPAGQALLL